jgi:D-3-phosphoglycerate dehydrogenase
MGQGLATRTLGLVGAGGIGQEILTLARPFFKRLIAADPYADPVQIRPLGCDLVPLDEVFRQSDFVVAIALLNAETRHMIGARQLALMKRSAYFLNMGRGPLVDEAALIATLREGRIAGAGLDVTEQEPIQNDNPLLAMDNVIVTPHALCWTDECFRDIAETALKSILDVSLGRRPRHVVGG